LLNNEAENIFFSTLKTEYDSLNLNACPTMANVCSQRKWA
jgi:hypothetical protein